MAPEIEGTSPEEVTTEVDTSTEAAPQETTGPDESAGINPAWAPIKEKLGDSFFALIQDDLKGWDKSANGRIESVNAELRGYKELGTPEELAQYRTVAQNLDSADPAELYAQIGEFLKQTGRMPTTQEAEQIAADVDEDAEEQQATTTDPRIDEIAQSQQQMREFLENQQRQDMERRAEESLNSEIKDVMETRGYSREDMKEVLSIAVSLSSQPQADGSMKTPPLSAAADRFDALRERILSTPRPGDSAPRLVPTSGGVPQGTPQKSLGERSRDETQDLVAAMLAQANG
jgi:hypothetical protein